MQEVTRAEFPQKDTSCQRVLRAPRAPEEGAGRNGVRASGESRVLHALERKVR